MASEHSIFYYPYASFKDEEAPLLKAAALYFDKLYILDPAKATFGRIGIGRMEDDVKLLETEGILTRVAPEEVLLRNEASISNAIRQDLADPEFVKLCSEKAGSRWTLALAKVPKALRADPAYHPLDESMKRVLTGYTEVYDEYRESAEGLVEYRYADYPFEVGEAIMLNHALVGSLLHTEAIPISTDPLHSRILNHKLLKAREIPEIRAVLDSRPRQQQFAGASAAVQLLTDVQLEAIPEQLTLEDILKYRDRHSADLREFRDGLAWMAREISDEPWTKGFDDRVNHDLIPKVHAALEPMKSSWSSWLKGAGLVLGGAAVGLGLFVNPLTPVAIGIAGLTIAKEAGVGGLELYRDWKSGKTQNGLHYLLKLRK